MSKKPMTWLELIKLKLAEEKAKGKAPSIGDVTPLAKKEWVQIKEGKHPLYIQGKAKTYARKKKGENKTRKNGSPKSGSPKPGSPKSGSPGSPGSAVADILAEVKLCGKCKKKVEKAMKKKGMKGGDVASNAANVGGNCNCGQGGGCNCAGPM